jgi:DNA-binding beta-propeller fold protein YncE
MRPWGNSAATAAAIGLLAAVGMGWLVDRAGAAERVGAAGGARGEFASETGRAVYHSPVELKYSPDGGRLAVSDRSAGAVAVLDVRAGTLLRTVPVGSRTGAVCWSGDGTRVYVALHDKAAVAEISATDGQILRTIRVGAYPNGVAVAPRRNLLIVTNTGLGDVSVVDLATGNERAQVKMPREPYYVAVTNDERSAVIGNLLPDGPGTDPRGAASVSVLSLNDFHAAQVKLPPGSTAVRHIAISQDGRWAYAAHTIGRTTLPATQLDRGWVNTNALSIVDLAGSGGAVYYATLLLDNLAEGAADPWGIAVSKDGGRMWITLGGAHEIAAIDLAGLHRGLAGQPIAQGAGTGKSNRVTAARHEEGSSTIWDDIAAEPGRRTELANDLSALYVARLMNRSTSPGKGPRGIDVSADGVVAVAQYFTGNVALIDATGSAAMRAISLGDQPGADAIRHGEFVFHDAGHTFQHWLSCATCHPNDGRVDGLNWDLMNDGLGNPKNVKSLLGAHLTAPMMWRAERENLEVAVRAGFRFESLAPPEESVTAVMAYIASLRPDPSPYLAGGGGALSAKALRGRELFESDKVGCSDCHSGALHTNKKRHNVGTRGGLDHDEEESFDTPALVEVWRTAPYLHDGRASTVQEVLTKYNAQDRHGVTSHLSKAEVDALAEYVLSLQ